MQHQQQHREPTTNTTKLTAGRARQRAWQKDIRVGCKAGHTFVDNCTKTDPSIIWRTTLLLSPSKLCPGYLLWRTDFNQLVTSLTLHEATSGERSWPICVCNSMPAEKPTIPWEDIEGKLPTIGGWASAVNPESETPFAII